MRIHLTCTFVWILGVGCVSDLTNQGPTSPGNESMSATGPMVSIMGEMAGHGTALPSTPATVNDTDTRDMQPDVTRQDAGIAALGGGPNAGIPSSGGMTHGSRDTREQSDAVQANSAGGSLQSPVSGQPSAGQQQMGPPQLDQPNAGEPSRDPPTAGQGNAAVDPAEQPSAGQANNALPVSGQSSAGQSSAGQSSAGQSSAGQSSAGQSSAGQSSAGQSNADLPAAGVIEQTAGEGSAGQAIAGAPMAEPETAGQSTGGMISGGQPASAGAGGQSPLAGPETCNGLDDDNDTRVDEDFELIGDDCSRGVGACLRTGRLRCDAEGNRVCLNALGDLVESGAPDVEICNGIDDDCDETIDDVVPDAGDQCTIGVPNCDAGSTFQCEVETEQLVCDQRLAENCQCEPVANGPHQYWLCRTPQTWENAQRICEFYGADLVTINAQLENTFVDTIRNQNGIPSVFIGANDRGEEGILRWATGDVIGQVTVNGGQVMLNAFGYTNFGNRQPDNWMNREDCVEMWADGAGTWNDVNCTNALPAVCEARCPDDQDEDEDGAERCKDDCDDSDPRRYPGAEEVCFDESDNDCDGQVDENCQGHACDISRLGDSLYLTCAGGNERSTRADARRYCADRGFALIQIDTTEENDFIARQAREATSGDFRRFWIGLTRENAAQWRWLGSDDPLGLADPPWADDEPSNDGDASCVSLYSETGQWQTLDCSASRRFICERSLDPQVRLPDFDN
ncbi:MAG: lectin-like protein [Myxococcota bacterium]|nr:lectin-like protein [Myxococcota bacterium]